MVAFTSLGEHLPPEQVGDIAAVVGLKEVITGETISDVKQSITKALMKKVGA